MYTIKCKESQDIKDCLLENNVDYSAVEKLEIEFLGIIDTLTELDFIGDMQHLQELKVVNWNGCCYNNIIYHPSLQRVYLPDCTLSFTIFALSDTIEFVELAKYRLSFISYTLVQLLCFSFCVW